MSQVCPLLKTLQVSIENIYFLSHEVIMSLLSETIQWQPWRARSCENSQRPWKQVMDCREQGWLVGEHTTAKCGRTHSLCSWLVARRKREPRVCACRCQSGHWITLVLFLFMTIATGVGQGMSQVVKRREEHGRV